MADGRVLEGAAHALLALSSVDAIMAQPMSERNLPPPSPEQFEKMCNQFWFKAVLALTKVARNDLLIARHLSLGLVQDCCVLGMMLRDRATGTTHHRTGGMGNEIIAALQATQQPYTPVGILDSIDLSAVAFDRLASEWSSVYRERRGPLREWLETARIYMRDGR